MVISWKSLFTQAWMDRIHPGERREGEHEIREECFDPTVG
jgi:hypothetical protein